MMKAAKENKASRQTGPLATPRNEESRVNVGNTERLLSVAGGALLAYLGTRGRSPSRIALALTGGALVVRGVSGYCPVNQAIGRDATPPKATGLQITRSVTINRPRPEVYSFWRQLENLPRFMKHLKEVRQLDPKRSHWEARLPGDVGTLDWEAEITAEEPNTRLAWQSLPGSEIENAGEVRFQDAPGDRGTELHAVISYRPPAGALGKAAASLFNEVFEQLVKEDLRRVKRLLETGELPTIEGQPAGRTQEPLLARLTMF
jgi:uncharacterized membrane protein